MQLWGKAANGAGEGGWLRALEVWGSGSAWLAAWGNCGQCFVRGRRIAEGSLGASPGDSAPWRQSVPPAPAGPRGPRACGKARAPVCFSESGESLLWGGGRRAGERWRRLGSDVAWGRGAAAAHPRADAHGPGPRGDSEPEVRGCLARGELCQQRSVEWSPIAAGWGWAVRPAAGELRCKMAAARWPRHHGCRPPAAWGQTQRPLAPRSRADRRVPPPLASE